MGTADAHYAAHLKVGRLLRGRVLTMVVVLRNIIVGFVQAVLTTDPGGEPYPVAPAWVVVTRKTDGRVVGRIAAGRGFGDGEALLASVRQTLQADDPEAFLRRYELEPN